MEYCCNICQKAFTDAVVYQKHLQSEKHVKQEGRASLESTVSPYGNKSVNEISSILSKDTAETSTTSSKCTTETPTTSSKGVTEIPVTSSEEAVETSTVSSVSIVETPVSLNDTTKISASSNDTKIPISNNTAEISVDSNGIVEPSTVSSTAPEAENKSSTQPHLPNAAVVCRKIEEYASCDMCNKRFTGIIPYEQHINSKIHQKTLERKGLQLKTLPTSEVNSKSLTAGENESITSAPTNISFFNYCNLCKKSFSGIIPYQQHIISISHQKQQQLHNGQIPLFVVPDKNCSSENASEAPKVDCTVPSHFACEVCGLKFSGPIPCHQHMSSAGHLKRLEKNQLLERISQSKPEDIDNIVTSEQIVRSDNLGGQSSTNITDTIEQNAHSQLVPSVIKNMADFRCEICDKVFNGIVPYNQHMISEVHRKHLKRREAMEKISLCTPNTQQTPLTLNFENKAATSDMNNLSRELIPPQDDDVNFAEVIVRLSIGGLKCTICQKPLTGPENAREHLQGKKHRKNVQQMMMLKNDENSQMKELSESFFQNKLILGKNSFCSETNVPNLGKKSFENLNPESGSSKNPDLRCDDCCIDFTSVEELIRHLESDEHIKGIKNQEANKTTPENAISERSVTDASESLERLQI